MEKIAGLKEKLHEATAFIFDMDGTLVDLEGLNYAAFKWTVDRYFKRSLTMEEYQSIFSGRRVRDGFARYLETNSLKEDAEELARFFNWGKKETLFTHPQEHLKIKEGAVGFLARLREIKKKTALATSTRSDFTEFIVDYFKLREYFDIILTSADVKRGKPDPEIFIKALGALSVGPADSMIFEDSINGMVAAKASGVYCVGIHNSRWNGDFIAQADAVIDNYMTCIGLLND